MADVKLRPARVRLGITDGIETEVVSGLDENAVVVTGSAFPQAAELSGGGTRNPFGGGRRGFGRF